MKKITVIVSCLLSLLFQCNVFGEILDSNTYEIAIDNQVIMSKIENKEEAIEQAKTIKNSSVWVSGILMHDKDIIDILQENVFDYGYFEVYQHDLLLKKFNSYKLAHEYALKWNHSEIKGKIKIWGNLGKFKAIPINKRTVVPQVVYKLQGSDLHDAIIDAQNITGNYKVYQYSNLVKSFKTKEEAVDFCEKYAGAYIIFVGTSYIHNIDSENALVLEKLLIDYGNFNIYQSETFVSSFKSIEEAMNNCKKGMYIEAEALIYVKSQTDAKFMDSYAISVFDDEEQAKQFAIENSDDMLIIASTSDKYPIGTVVYDKALEVSKSREKIRAEKITELNKVISNYSGDIAVYYKNINTGYTYKYNENKVFDAASVIKAPYCLYVYEKAKKEGLDLEKTHTYTKGLYMGGSGVIKDMHIGTTLTENELLKQAIRSSDNIAFRMLSNKFGSEGFKAFLNEKGLDSSKLNTLTNARVNAIDVMEYASIIYDFISQDGLLENQFKTDLMSTTEEPMIISKYPNANKYGQWKKSFHDMAIIYSDSPYILVILTDKEGPTEKNFEVFKTLSNLIETFNESE